MTFAEFEALADKWASFFCLLMLVTLFLMGGCHGTPAHMPAPAVTKEVRK